MKQEIFFLVSNVVSFRLKEQNRKICRSKPLRARILVVSNLRSEIKGPRFESRQKLCTEVSCLQLSPG